MSLSDEEIIEVAKQLYGDDLTEAQLRNHKTITFARLIQQKQIEIDAALCEAEEPWGNEADAWAEKCLRKAAVAIRSQK